MPGALSASSIGIKSDRSRIQSRRRPEIKALVDTGNQARGPGAVRLVLVAKLRAQQPLFRTDAREQRQHRECSEQHADTRTKRQAPSERVDEQPQVAGMPDQTIDAVGDQRVPGLDRDQPVKRLPSTKTGHRRSAPPAAKRTTPSHRIVSPSIVQKSMRSV